VTIKGTLETFNFRELLQMLAFNQKVGTLILETARGTQTIYVDKGRVAFVEGDHGANEALLRVLRRLSFIPQDRLERALKIQQSSQRYLGEILEELGAASPEDIEMAGTTAAGERFLTLQLTSVSHFEFADGHVVAPDRSESRPIRPWLVVDSLLLDLTRKMDQWVELSRVVPGMSEVYETTGLGIDIETTMAEEEIDVGMAEMVVAAYDGFRNLTQVAEVSTSDELTVVQVTAALVERGAVRAVPTPDLLARGEDLLSRGEAHKALPLLRRGIERPDAPPEARLRLADALVASGKREEAATQLDTFATLSEDSQPRTVFDALHRALTLRDGDMATASRLADFYLRNRPWLDDRQEQALEALRALIHGAVTSRRPLEAARRLAEFIRNGDAPGEDLLVLADLYASAGESTEAASALYARAEDLIAAGRVGAGKELLQRTVKLDPTRADARSRLHVLQGEDQRKRRRRRTTVFLVLLGLLLCGLGAAWLAYNDEANESVRGVRERAEASVHAAEEKAYQVLDAFEARLAAAAEATVPDAGLAEAAHDMTTTVQEVIGEAEKDVYALAQELERYPALANRGINLNMHRHLESRCETAISRATDMVEAARERGRAALVAGEAAHKDGRFREAQKNLVLARNLAFDDEAFATRAITLLSHVERYIEEFETELQEIEALRRSGNLQETYAASIRLLGRKLDSDLTRELKLPVEVRSDPAGAEVRLGGRDTRARTPCIIEYSPFTATDLEVRLPGRVPQYFALPSFDDILDDAEKVAGWTASVRADLPSGPAWRVEASRGPFSQLWQSGRVPVLLTEDGEALVLVNVTVKDLGLRRSFRRPNPVRRAGTLGDGHEWRIFGTRTLAVLPPGGQPWELSFLGRLDRPPCIANGSVVIIDELGTVYALDAETGTQRWRRALGSAPNQPPLASNMGILVSTVAGGVLALDPRDGKVRNLGVDARGFSLVLPFGEGAVVLGGGTDQVRLSNADGTVTRRGTAMPTSSVDPWVSRDGVAWVEADGVHWLGVNAEEPVLASGLGPTPTGICGRDGFLYAGGQDGLVRCVRVDRPTEAVWVTDAGAPVQGAPLPLGDLLFVLAGGGLVVIAR